MSEKITQKFAQSIHKFTIFCQFFALLTFYCTKTGLVRYRFLKFVNIFLTIGFIIFEIVSAYLIARFNYITLIVKLIDIFFMMNSGMFLATIWCRSALKQDKYLKFFEDIKRFDLFLSQHSISIDYSSFQKKNL